MNFQQSPAQFCCVETTVAGNEAHGKFDTELSSNCEYVVFNTNYSFLAYVDSNWLIFWFFYLNPDSEIISLVE